MSEVLNGLVAAGDLVAYSARKRWGMYTRIGQVVSADPDSLLVRVTKSSDDTEVTRLVRLTNLKSVVKVNS